MGSGPLGHEQRILSSHIPLCHRHMVIAMTIWAGPLGGGGGGLMVGMNQQILSYLKCPHATGKTVTALQCLIQSSVECCREFAARSFGML